MSDVAQLRTSLRESALAKRRALASRNEPPPDLALVLASLTSVLEALTKMLAQKHDAQMPNHMPTFIVTERNADGSVKAFTVELK